MLTIHESAAAFFKPLLNFFVKLT